MKFNVGAMTCWGLLIPFFFALIVVIMRHVEPKAEKTMIKKAVNKQ